MATRKTTKPADQSRRATDDPSKALDAIAHAPAPSVISAMATVLDAVSKAEQSAPAPKTVALRGGAAVSKVRVKEGAKYNTKAEHNQKWWNHLMKTCKDEGAAVTELTKEVPAHFIGYCLRRGYLEQA